MLETDTPPLVIFVAVAATLNSPAPGVVVTLLSCVIPLYTCISVPDPVYVTVPDAVVGNVWASFVSITA